MISSAKLPGKLPFVATKMETIEIFNENEQLP